MTFYNLSRSEREQLVEKINADILFDLQKNQEKQALNYFSDEDTYIRKNAYLAIGRIYKTYGSLRIMVVKLLKSTFQSDDAKVRQTVVNSAGEIGILDFEVAQPFMEKGLFDKHHSVRNAVIGSIKKMGEKNPGPVLAFAKRYLHHEDKEVRREICHGIELRGRKYPQDILPLLRELQHDETSRVRSTLVHVIGQISYKKGCLETVVADLKKWENQDLVKDALDEIIDVHHRYRNFSVKTQKEAIQYISKNF